jgi:hypothetical protein
MGVISYVRCAWHATSRHAQSARAWACAHGQNGVYLASLLVGECPRASQELPLGPLLPRRCPSRCDAAKFTADGRRQRADSCRLPYCMWVGRAPTPVRLLKGAPGLAT